MPELSSSIEEKTRLIGIMSWSGKIWVAIRVKMACWILFEAFRLRKLLRQCKISFLDALPVLCSEIPFFTLRRRILSSH